MLIQKNTAPILNIIADIPLVTAGVVSWAQGVATAYYIAVNGGLLTGIGSISDVIRGTSGPDYLQITTNIVEFTATGPGVIWVVDSSDNVIAKLQIQVVDYNPYT